MRLARRVFFAPQSVARAYMRIPQPGFDPFGHDRADRTRKEKAGDNRGADNADENFLRPRQRNVKNRVWRVDSRETDDRRGISREHEGVGARRSVEQ